MFIILRLHYLHPALASADPTFNAVLASIWMEVEVDYCLLACTIPCLKPFMVACNTGWGHVSPQTGDGSNALKSGSYGGSYGLRSLDKTGAKTTITSHRDLKDINGKRHRETTGHNSVDAGRKSHGQELHPDQGGDETTQSIVSNDSTQMIIRREVGWTVTYDDDTTPSTEHPSVHGPQTVRSDIEAQSRMHAV